jgi:hypothetical protein
MDGARRTTAKNKNALILWNSLPDEFIGIPKEVIGMGTTYEDKPRIVPKVIRSGVW